MKRASGESLVALEALLRELRSLAGVTERKPGIFYRQGGAFLHFHEDPAGLFADVKLDGAAFSRWPVNTEDERALLLTQVRWALVAGRRGGL